ncbi:MAG TPA: PEP-CTERM sorting domain-containing protein, partial [Chthoniobacterales bacterium]|nr:PEP-CTERM sorting domain-containing protein [Chthoniobacterales bacterium]
NSNRSFIFANTDGTEPDLNNPADNQFLSSNAAAGITGNWLVRANAVPEPSTWAMVGLGGALLLGLMRYRARVS